jgi:hypothetical protein
LNHKSGKVQIEQKVFRFAPKQTFVSAVGAAVQLTNRSISALPSA